MPLPFVVLNTREPAWDDSYPMEEHENRAGHAAFMNALEADRFVLLGGPLVGTREIVLIVQGEDASQIAARLAPDPWMRNGFLVMKATRPWDVRIGSFEVLQG